MLLCSTNFGRLNIRGYLETTQEHTRQQHANITSQQTVALEADKHPNNIQFIPKRLDSIFPEMKLLDRGTTKDELFEATMDCYKRSVELCPTDESKRRTGNACNMISTYHTNRATGW